MNPIPSTVCLSALLALTTLPSAHAGDPAHEASIEASLDAIFGENISDDTPGCALGVRRNEVEWQRAWGRANLEQQASLTPDSVFNIGSVAKQVTAMAVLLLASEGRLSLEDDVRRHLPELPRREHPITVDDLLHHTSGLRDFRATDWLLGRDTLAVGNADVLAYAARQRELNHSPGESHLYSNTGYVLLALVVERVSGQTLSDFTRERLFAPAGMTHTRWEDDPRQVVPGRAIGYTLDAPATDDTPARFLQMPTARRTTGHGGLLSTVGDMLRWNDALSRDAFGGGLTAQLEQRGRLRNGTELDYARGVFVGEYRGQREVQHGGYTGTYTAWVGRYPDASLSIALLCNGDGDDVSARSVADLFLPEPLPAATGQADGETSPMDLSARSGMYRDLVTGDLAMLDFPAEAQLVDGAFVQGPLAYRFDAESPDRLHQTYYGNVSEWQRLPATAVEPSSLASYTGRYRSDELLGDYEVRLDGRQLWISVHGLSAIAAPLHPVARDVFLAEGIRMPVEFRRASDGSIEALTLSPRLLRGLVFERAGAHGQTGSSN